MSLALQAVKLILLIFCLASILLYLYQGRLIYYPQKLSKGIPERFKSCELTLTSQAISLHGWFLKKKMISSQSPLVIYYGGNAEEVSGNLEDLDRIDAGAFLLMNYRGFGASQGKPEETALCTDALTIFDSVVDREGISSAHVILMGRSLGSGVACYVASQRRVGGVILVTPFDSLVAVARHHYPLFPVGLLLRHRFDSLALAPSITTPMLALVAENDDIIPLNHSTALTDHWAGRTTTVIIGKADHNDLHLDNQYWQAINDFIHEHFPGTDDPAQLTDH